MLGFCSEGEHRLIVLELMGGGCLSDILAAGGFSLEWIKRLQVRLPSFRWAAGLEFRELWCLLWYLCLEMP